MNKLVNEFNLGAFCHHDFAFSYLLVKFFGSMILGDFSKLFVQHG
jgi:hypothetical protein